MHWNSFSACFGSFSCNYLLTLSSDQTCSSSNCKILTKRCAWCWAGNTLSWWQAVKIDFVCLGIGRYPIYLYLKKNRWAQFLSLKQAKTWEKITQLLHIELEHCNLLNGNYIADPMTSGTFSALATLSVLWCRNLTLGMQKWVRTEKSSTEERKKKKPKRLQTQCSLSISS